MSAHRYWRAVSLEAYGYAGLELTEFQLLAGGVRVDASATLTSNIAPSSGSLANLKDDDTATGAAWPFSAVSSLVLSWDFGGSPQDVSDIRLGSGSDPIKFLQTLALQWSNDGVAWDSNFSLFGNASLLWPGVRAKTKSKAGGVWDKSDSGAPAWAAVDLSDERIINVASVTTSAYRGALPYLLSGIRQFEVVFSGSVSGFLIGLTTPGGSRSQNLGSGGSGYSYIAGTGNKYDGNSDAYGAPLAVGDVLGVVFDFGTGTLAFYKNGVSMGVAFSGLTGKTLAPAVGSNGSSTTAVITLKTSGLSFPVAGATDWDATYSVQTGTVADSSSVISIPTAISIPLPYGQTILTQIAQGRNDYLTGVLGQGIGRVKGTTKDKGTPSNLPVSERVRLYRQSDGLLIRELWSTPGTGAYSFDYVDELQTYFVVSFDHDGLYRAVIADGLNLANGKVELIP